jgi:hypothetical protein
VHVVGGVIGKGRRKHVGLFAADSMARAVSTRACLNSAYSSYIHLQNVNHRHDTIVVKRQPILLICGLFCDVSHMPRVPEWPPASHTFTQTRFDGLLGERMEALHFQPAATQG